MSEQRDANKTEQEKDLKIFHCNVLYFNDVFYCS